jgi:hypothetical protein
MGDQPTYVPDKASPEHGGEEVYFNFYLLEL